MNKKEIENILNESKYLRMKSIKKSRNPYKINISDRVRCFESMNLRKNYSEEEIAALMYSEIPELRIVHELTDIINYKLIESGIDPFETFWGITMPHSPNEYGIMNAGTIVLDKERKFTGEIFWNLNFVKKQGGIPNMGVIRDAFFQLCLYNGLEVYAFKENGKPEVVKLRNPFRNFNVTKRLSNRSLFAEFDDQSSYDFHVDTGHGYTWEKDGKVNHKGQWEDKINEMVLYQPEIKSLKEIRYSVFSKYA